MVTPSLVCLVDTGFQLLHSPPSYWRRLVHAGALTVSNAVSVVTCIFTLTFTLLLLPFTHMSLYVSDRKFYALDIAANLYAPSAYYFAQVWPLGSSCVDVGDDEQQQNKGFNQHVAEQSMCTIACIRGTGTERV